MNKHTPNRWTVTHDMQGIGNLQVWGIVTADTGESVANCGTTGEGTARFIVHAVNCHAELIDALEACAEVFEDPTIGPDDPDTPALVNRVLRQARAAIARARGE